MILTCEPQQLESTFTLYTENIFLLAIHFVQGFESLELINVNFVKDKTSFEKKLWSNIYYLCCLYFKCKQLAYCEICIFISYTSQNLN